MDTDGDLISWLEQVGFANLDLPDPKGNEETNFVSGEEPLQGILGPSAHYSYIYIFGPNFVHFRTILTH